MPRTKFLLAVAGALLITAGCSKAADSTTTAATTTTAAATTTKASGTGSGSDSSGAETTTTASGSGQDSASGQSFVAQVAKAGLPASVSTCLTEKSNSDPAFKTFVEMKGTPTLEQSTKLMPIVFDCMTKEQFASLVVTTASTPMSAAGAACVTQLISGLSTDDIAGLAANDTATMDRVNPQLVACAKA